MLQNLWIPNKANTLDYTFDGNLEQCLGRLISFDLALYNNSNSTRALIDHKTILHEHM